MTEDKRVEFIESYIKIGNSDYKWNDNHGELIRCKDCKYYGRADKRRFYRGYDCLEGRIASIVPDRDYCSRAERREE